MKRIGLLLVVPDDVLLAKRHQLLPEQEPIAIEGGVNPIASPPSPVSSGEDASSASGSGTTWTALASGAADLPPGQLVLELIRLARTRSRRSR